MKALLLDFESRQPVERTLPDPAAPADHEVLLRIVELGVCATDRELVTFRFGEPPPGESFLILGHEALACVEAAGDGVTGIATGDWVVPMLRRPCDPTCPSCRAGRLDLCTSGNYRERGILRAHGYGCDLTLDEPESLIRVPESLLDIAVLLEPLSVVEKAVETALRLHPPGAKRAAVFGAGPIGILTAFSLLIRGLDVAVVSVEQTDSPRAQLLAKAGAAYLRATAPPPADIVFEASGAAGNANAALDSLAPLGVLVFIGYPLEPLVASAGRLIEGNLIVAGIVNASRDHFRLALEDLARVPRDWTSPLIERRPFHAWPDSLAHPAETPKTVHRL